MSDDNYYEQLGVESGASRDEIRDAHRARVSDLEAAREKKGISDSQLQQNREEVAQVRAAWNVLSDPFQRKRYDAQLSAPAGDEIDLVDAEAEDAASAPGTEVQLTGWRKFMAPPPPKPTPAKNGANGKAKAQPTRNGRPRPEPTIVIPGMPLAEPRQRGMALLFDIAVLLVIFTGVTFVLPGLLQSDYKDIQDRITKVNDLHDARLKVDDANKSVAHAKSASDTKSAQSDLKSAKADYTKAKTDAAKAGVVNTDGTVKQLQKQSDNLTEKIRTTTYITSAVTLLLAMVYLVPITALKGQTFGMRNRRLRVVRVDGSPAGWYASFVRFFVPVLLAIAIPTIGAILGIGMVAWAYFDRNGRGLHDKLAKTVVVSA